MAEPTAPGRPKVQGIAGVQVNLPASGAAGFAPPPANPQAVTYRPDGSLLVTGNAAPRELNAPVSTAMQNEMLAKAMANERQLAPLTFADSVTPGGAPLGSVAPVAVPAAQLPPPAPPLIITPVASPLRIPGQGRIILTDAPALPAAPQVVEAVSTVVEQPLAQPAIPQVNRTNLVVPTAQPNAQASSLLAAAQEHAAPRDAQVAAAMAAPGGQQPYYPAGSNTDTPSRGLPTGLHSLDPGKQVTGGFGQSLDGQYFPLNGMELREEVRGHMSVIDDQMERDMRFSIALCYPRVRVKVKVEIIAWAQDGSQYDPSFAIERVKEINKVPLDVAEQHADEVCFVIMRDRREMTDDGQSITPPNQLRADLGLPIPMKQAISTPQGQLLVDIPYQR